MIDLILMSNSKTNFSSLFHFKGITLSVKQYFLLGKVDVSGQLSSIPIDLLDTR